MVQVLPYGDRALLVELDEPETVTGYADAVRTAALAGVVDVVPAARTVLVVFDQRVTSPAALTPLLAVLDPLAAPRLAASPAVIIDVRYNGEDLAAIAAHCGVTIDEVIELHRAGRYRSAFCGFAPGFAYLSGLDSRLFLPRRVTPRTRVRAGAVAIAAEYCGIYPRDMPGGWHIVGHTDAPLWDLARAQPALLAPGTTVSFRVLG